MNYGFLVAILLPLVQGSLAAPPASPPATSTILGQSVQGETVLSPDAAGFNQRMADHALRIETRTSEGRLIRKAAAVLSSDSGYIMTSLDAVAGGSTFAVSGGVVGAERVATPLGITRVGRLAILQLRMQDNERLTQPPRATAPPGVGDRLFAAVHGRDTKVEARVVSLSDAKDKARLLRISVAVDPGTAFYNTKAQLVAIAYGTVAAKKTSQAVYLLPRMPGDWVEIFPASPEDPVVIAPQ